MNEHPTSFGIACRSESVLRCTRFKGFGGLENAQTTETENVTNNQVSVEGGSGGSTVGIGGENNNVTLNEQSVDVPVIQAVTNSLATLAQLGQSESAQSEQYDNQTVNGLASDLAAITANAAPQSAAASNEILAGSSPLAGAEPATSNQTGFWSNFNFSDETVNIAVVLGTVLSIWVFLKSRGKSS